MCNSHDTRAPGGAAAVAAARAGGRIRTGRSSDRLGGRCSVCQSAPSACAARARSGAGKRGGAGTRGGGGEQASGPRAARRTGDRQAGDGPESDRAQRSERADRRLAAADLEGVRSATVGVGGRPSCGEEGGRQVRVVRVALHRPKHSGFEPALRTPVKSALPPKRVTKSVPVKRGVVEVLEVDILWPRWVARIGVTRSTQARFLTADRQCTELPLLPSPRLRPTAPASSWAVRGLPLAPRLFFPFLSTCTLFSSLFSRENSVEIVKFWALSRV